MNNSFTYHQNQLYCENTALADIAQAVGTPTYIYSKASLVTRAAAFGNGRHQPIVCYAVKANNNPHLLRLLGEMGLGADVTSGGELFLAQQAGIPSERIIFSGVGKTQAEILAAMQSDIRAIHIESAMEMDMIAAVATAVQKKVSIGVRVNPNIAAETHPYNSTGMAQHKFGVARATAVAILQQAQNHPWLQPVAIACHIGSQISDLKPYASAADFLIELAAELSALGIELDYLDVGGGLGIDYTQDNVPQIGDWVTAVTTPIHQAGYQTAMEPGRSIVGQAGTLLTKVIYTKQQGSKNFVIVDAAMNDLIRPTLYQAFHPILPVQKSDVSEKELIIYDVVGPVCETGDWLAKQRPLPPLHPGDLLAITHAGAYSFAMSSNYNGRLRPPEILVDGANFQIIRQRQTYDHLLSGTIL